MLKGAGAARAAAEAEEAAAIAAAIKVATKAAAEAALKEKKKKKKESRKRAAVDDPDQIYEIERIVDVREPQPQPVVACLRSPGSSFGTCTWTTIGSMVWRKTRVPHRLEGLC